MRDFVRARPLLGSALLGVLVCAGFAAINLAAGENAADSLIAGLFLGIATAGALALRYLLSRGHARR